MERRFPQSPQLNEKCQPGCRWGFRSVFELLFHGHSSGKLLPNTSTFNRHCRGNDHVKARNDFLLIPDEEYLDVKGILVDSRDGSVGEAKGRHSPNCPGYLSGKNRKSDRTSWPTMQNDSNMIGHKRKNTVDIVSHSTLRGVFCHYLHLRSVSKGHGCKSINSVNIVDSNGLKVQRVNVDNAAEELVNQKLGRSQRSKQFLEALEILNSNKELFLKLLEDPESLLMKHIKDLRESQAKGQRGSEYNTPQCYGRKLEGTVRSRGWKHKRIIVSWKRVKLRKKLLLKRNKIVILKPETEREFENESHRSYFAFKNLTSKLRWTVTRQGKANLPAARHSKETDNRNESRGEYFLKVFTKGEKFQKGYRRSLSHPGYDLSPFFSSERTKGNSLIAAQMGFYPYGKYNAQNDCEPRNEKEMKSSHSTKIRLNGDGCMSQLNPERKSDIKDICLFDAAGHETMPSADSVGFEGHMEEEKMDVDRGEDSACRNEGTSTAREHEDETEVSSLDHQESSPANVHTAENLVRLATNHVGLSMDSEIIQSMRMNKLGPSYHYMMEVLLAAHLKWDELLMKCQVSDQLLLPTIFQEVRLASGSSDTDSLLLFDYVNEVLLEVHLRNRTKIGSFLAEENLAREVMRCVDWDLVLQNQARTLQQLVHKDLAKPRSWLDDPDGSDDIVVEVVESILEGILSEI